MNIKFVSFIKIRGFQATELTARSLGVFLSTDLLLLNTLLDWLS